MQRDYKVINLMLMFFSITITRLKKLNVYIKLFIDDVMKRKCS